MDWSSLTDDAAPASNAPTSLTSVATASEREQGAAKLLSPANPMFAFGALLAVTFGLAAFATSVRVGNSSASLKIGDA